jgi:hypothetical protein
MAEQHRCELFGTADSAGLLSLRETARERRDIVEVWDIGQSRVLLHFSLHRV